jgi:hypothetical protein
MSRPRRIALDELTLRPGTYFNPQTEILIVVDDSPEVAHEIFDAEEFDSSEWVIISDDAALDEHKRDELVESFQQAHAAAAEELEDDFDDEDDDEDKLDPDEEDDELEGVEELELGED